MATSEPAGKLAEWARDKPGITLLISKKPKVQVRFKVLSRRRIVEQSLS